MSGVVSIDRQRYAIPLDQIKSIESSYEVKTVDGLPVIQFGGKDILICDLEMGRDIGLRKRRLCLIINNIALMADGFQTKNLAVAYIRKLPTIMANRFLDGLYFNHSEDELIQILNIGYLPAYFVGRSVDSEMNN